jgi:hypothetical protein
MVPTELAWLIYSVEEGEPADHYICGSTERVALLKSSAVDVSTLSITQYSL